MTKPKAPLGTEPRHCDVCGRALRYGNTSGICSGTGSTPACKRERTNRERIAAGLLPHKRRENVPPPGELISVRAGEPYNSWTVLEDGWGVTFKVRCRCACGVERPVLIAALTSGQSKSCGRRCEARRAANPYLLPGTYGRLEVLETGLRSKDMVRIHCYKCGRDTTKQAFLIKRSISATCGCGSGKFTHGLSRHPLYGVWNGMWDRCANPKATGYKDYGGRGITVHEPWRDPAVFIEDIEREIGPRPEEVDERGRHLYELDRINNDGNYEPGNVRWADKKTQANNRRSAGSVTLKLDAALAEVERLNRLLASMPAPRKRGQGAPENGQAALF